MVNSMKRILSPRECVQQALGYFILDFRRWMVAETKLLNKWKSQRVAYSVAEGRLVNDFNAMLDSYRKKTQELPMLLIAIQQIASPPDLSQIIGTPFDVKTIIKSDPLKRHVVLRTEPRAYHVQFVFLANDPDSANAFTSQFCSYIRLMEKRRIPVNYFLSPDLRDEWDITIYDNSLYPDKADLEESNLVAGLVEFDFAGLTPRVIKELPPLYPDEFPPEDQNAGNPVQPIDPENPHGEWNVVVEADLFKGREGDYFTRAEVDMKTGERSHTTIEK